MQALASPSIGSISNLRVMDVPMPEPGAGQVRVVVHCAAVNPADPKMLEGQFIARFLHSTKLPMIPGYDVAGVVDAVGAGVSDLAVGDRVFGHQQYASATVHGTFAEATVIDANAVAKLPDDVAFATAAAATTAAMTALQSLRDIGGLSSGGRVLVVGAAGGVGTLAVAIAKRLGAHVTAICNARTAEMVSKLGADVVLDRSAGDPYASGGPYDVIFDTPGVCTLGQVSAVLAADGTLVTTMPTMAFAAAKLATLLSRRSVGFVNVKSKRADLALVGGWLADGMPVAIEARFPVRDGAKAIAALTTGGRTGRIIVDVAGGW